MFTQFVPNPRHLWTLIASMIIPIAIVAFLPTGQRSVARPFITEVSGTIEEDTAWTQANSPYVMCKKHDEYIKILRSYAKNARQRI